MIENDSPKKYIAFRTLSIFSFHFLADIWNHWSLWVFSRFKKKHSANYTIGLFVNMDEITLDNDGDVMAVQAERWLFEECFQLTRLPSYHLRQRSNLFWH